MVTILPPVRRESFSSLLGRGVGEHLNQRAQSRMQQEAMLAQEAQKMRLLEHEYGLKGQLQQIGKPLTDLQKAQKELAEARTAQARGQTNFFDELMGNVQPPEQQLEKRQQFPGIERPEEDFQQFHNGQIDPQNPQTWPEDALKKAAGFKGQHGPTGVIGNIAQSELDRREKEQGREFEKYKLGRHEETEISKPILLEMNQIRKNIPLQEQAIADIKEAAPSVSALDYFADVTGFEPLRSAQGAKLKTGIKDFFLSDLTRVGARPNQWIEQQLADALPKIGRSAEANLITAEGLQFKLDLAKKRIEEIDKLAEEDRKKYGFVKGDIDSRAFREIKKYAIDRQKQLQDDIKKIKAQNKGKKNTFVMISPEGSIYEIDSNDYDEAIKHGFKLNE